MATDMFHYTSCGLDNVWLRNGYEIQDTKYGEAVAIHDIEGLHKAIGLQLVNNTPHLSGSEIRFLRQELDVSQDQLADLLGVSDTTIRNWEQDRVEIPGPAERVLRILYREHISGDGTVRDLVDRISRLNREIHEKRLEFEEVNGGWRSTAA